jgi:two-component sensor histidine kinase
MQSHEGGARNLAGPLNPAAKTIDALRRENEEKAVLLDELRHRMKNNFQMTQSLLRLKKSLTADANAKRDFAAIETLMAALNGVDGELFSIEGARPIALDKYLRRLCSKLRHVFVTKSQPTTFDVRLAEVQVTSMVAGSIGLIVNEAVTNSFKHAVPNGATEIFLSLTRDTDTATLSVGDNGPGLPPGWRSYRGGTALMERLAARVQGRIECHSDTCGVRYVVDWPLFVGKVSRSSTLRALSPAHSIDMDTEIVGG